MKYTLFVVFFMPLLCAAQISSHVWTGAANNQWNNAANWQPASVPSASSSVRIDTCANCPVVLAGNVQVADLYVFESGINLGEHTLKCGELSVYFSVFVSNNSLIDATEILVFTENTINGDIRFETNQGQFQGGNTFNNKVQITTNVCGNCAGFVMYAPIVFEGDVLLQNKGRGFGVSAYSGAVTFKKKLKLLNEPSDDITFQYFGQKEYPTVRGNVVFEDSVVIIDNNRNPNARVWFTDARFAAPATITTKGATVSFGVKNTQIESTLHLKSKGGAYEFATNTGGEVVFTNTGNLKVEKGDCLATKVTLANCKYLNAAPLVIDFADSDTNQIVNQFITFEGLLMTAKLTVLSPRIQLHGGIFKQPATFNRLKSAYLPQSCGGGNVFEDSLIVINSSGSSWFWGQNRSDVFKKPVVAIHAGGDGSMLHLANANRTTFSANVILQSTPDASNEGGVFLGFIADSAVLDSSARLIVENFGEGTAGLFNIRQRGASIENYFLLQNNATLRFQNTKFDGPVRVDSPQIYVSNSVFLKSTFFTKTGNGTNNSLGNNTFHNRFQWVNNAYTGAIKFLNNSQLIK